MKKVLQITLFFLCFQGILSTWLWWVAKTIPSRPPISNNDLYKGVAKESNPWLEPWQRWDTPQYQAIAIHGYDAFDTALFTPPLYPLAMHVFAPLFFNNELASGLFLSSIAFLGCIITFYFLNLQEFSDNDHAWRSIKYLAFFPTSFFLIAAYNESLYLLNLLLCFYFIKRNKWVTGGIFAGLAAFTRLPGALLIIPLTWASWDAYHHKGHKFSWLAPIITALGATIFPLYVWLYLKTSPLKILEALNKRGGYLTLPGINIIEAARRLFNGQLVEENFTELSFALFLIIMTFFIWQKLPKIYGLYSVTMTMFFLSRFGSPQPLVSMARYTIEIFPIFIVLAIWGGKTWINRIIVYIFWIGLLFSSGQFAIWGWVG